MGSELQLNGKTTEAPRYASNCVAPKGMRYNMIRFHDFMSMARGIGSGIKNLTAQPNPELQPLRPARGSESGTWASTRILKKSKRHGDCFKSCKDLQVSFRQWLATAKAVLGSCTNQTSAPFLLPLPLPLSRQHFRLLRGVGSTYYAVIRRRFTIFSFCSFDKNIGVFDSCRVRFRTLSSPSGTSPAILASSGLFANLAANDASIAGDVAHAGKGMSGNEGNEGNEWK